MKRWPYQLVLVSVLLLGGCKPESDNRLRLRMAHVYDVSSPTHAYGTAFLSERVRKISDSLDVTVYPSAQLGSESELLEQLVAGESRLVGNSGSVTDYTFDHVERCTPVIV